MKIVSKILLVLNLFLSFHLFGQNLSYDSIPDTLNFPNVSIGDNLLYQANYYKAQYYFNELNILDSLIKNERELIRKIDTAHIYYCLASRDKKFYILFFAEKLDSSMFVKNEIYKNAFNFRDITSSLFYKEAFDACYVYCLLAEVMNEKEWKVRKGFEVFYGESDIQKVKREAVVSLLANKEYFYSFRQSFWNRVFK